MTPHQVFTCFFSHGMWPSSTSEFFPALTKSNSFSPRAPFSQSTKVSASRYPCHPHALDRPFLFGKLRAGDASEQIGAAMGLAEVFVRMEKAGGTDVSLTAVRSLGVCLGVAK